MADPLKIIIDADVSKGIAGLDRFDSKLSETTSSVDKLSKSVNKPLNFSIVPKFEPVKVPDIKPIPVPVVPKFEPIPTQTAKPILVPVIPNLKPIPLQSAKPIVVQVIPELKPIPQQKPLIVPVIPKVEPIPVQTAKPVILPVIPNVEPIRTQAVKPIVYPVIPEVKPVPEQKVKPIVVPVIPEVKQVTLPKFKPVSVSVKADTTKAISGLDRLEKEFNETTSSATKFATSVANSTTKASASLGRFSQTSGQSVQVLTNLSRVAQDLPFGFIGIANNINPLFESLGRLRQQAKATGTSLLGSLGAALSGPAGIGLALGVGSSLLISFGDDLKRLITDSNGVDAALDKAFDNFDKNASKVVVLANALKSNTLSAAEAKKAQKELIDQAPEFQSAFSKNGVNVKELDEILTKKYIPGLIRSIKVTAAFGIINEKLAESIKQIAKGGSISFGEQISAFFEGGLTLGGALSKGVEKGLKNLDNAKKALESENISKLIENTFKSLGITFNDVVADIDDGKEKVKKSLDQLNNELISRAKLFVKEFGSTFVLPDLEETFFGGKKKVLADAKKLLDDISKGQLKIKIPVQTDFEFLPEPTVNIERLTENFLKDIKPVQVDVPIDISLTPQAIDKINKKLDLEKQFNIFGNLGKNLFKSLDFGEIGGKIDFSQMNKGLQEGIKLFNQMFEIATTLNQAIGQGLVNSFNSVFDAILDGKNVFKALGDALKQLVINTIKAIAQMLILKAITNFIFPGGGGAFGAARGVFTLAANTGNSFGLGNQIGNRAFQNTLQVVVSGQISNDVIRLAGQRSANSSVR